MLGWWLVGGKESGEGNGAGGGAGGRGWGAPVRDPPSASGGPPPPLAPPLVPAALPGSGFICQNIRARNASLSEAMFVRAFEIGRREEAERKARGDRSGTGRWETGRRDAVRPTASDKLDGEPLLDAICDWDFMQRMNKSVRAESGSMLADVAQEQPATLMDQEGFLPSGIVSDEQFGPETLYVFVRVSARISVRPYLSTQLWNRMQNFFNLHPDTARSLPVVLVWMPPDLLKLVLNRAYFQSVVADEGPARTANAGEPVPMDPQSGDDPVIKQSRAWIVEAIARHASDIHVEPMEGGGRIRIRVHGILEYLARNVSLRVMSQFVTWIKAQADMDISDNRRPLDGSLRISYTEGGHLHVLDVRVSAIPVVHGQKMVMRLLDPDALGKLSRQGLAGAIWDPVLLKRFDTALRTRDGIVLVTGPTGSGKTTTLNIALLHLLREDVFGDRKNIVTIEDPVEYSIRGANQTQVNDAAGVTFAATLRSLLRQDPDIMLVGEIRDSETAQIAVQAALTGHLILATLHTNDSLGSVSRLQDLGVTPFLVASTLRLVQAQRLVRRFCEHCGKEEANVIDPAALPDMLSHSRLKPYLPALTAPAATVRRPGGCLRCNGSGYSGRIAVMEMAASSPELVSGIERNLPSRQLEEIAREHSGYRPMIEDGVDMVAAGITSLEEIASISLKDLASEDL